MKTSILIATYGGDEWRDLAWSRAYPSAAAQDAHEVIVLHEPEMSIAEVRNAAAAQATGDWLLFLDADDELDGRFLAVMDAIYQRLHSRAEARFVLTPAVVDVHASGKRKPPRFPPGRNLQSDNYLVVGSMVERDLFNEVGGFSDYPHGFEDWSLWAKCWKAGAEIIKVKQAYYIRHVNPNSKHRVAWMDRKWQADMHHKVRMEIFPELY